MQQSVSFSLLTIYTCVFVMENKHRFVFHPEGAVERETVRCSPKFSQNYSAQYVFKNHK